MNIPSDRSLNTIANVGMLVCCVAVVVLAIRTLGKIEDRFDSVDRNVDAIRSMIKAGK